jgi:hypothetical protein
LKFLKQVSANLHICGEAVLPLVLAKGQLPTANGRLPTKKPRHSEAFSAQN